MALICFIVIGTKRITNCHSPSNDWFTDWILPPVRWTDRLDQSWNQNWPSGCCVVNHWLNWGQSSTKKMGSLFLNGFTAFLTEQPELLYQVVWTDREEFCKTLSDNQIMKIAYFFIILCLNVLTSITNKAEISLLDQLNTTRKLFTCSVWYV